jgi:DNA-binding Xre family transcriptional regulator
MAMRAYRESYLNNASTVLGVMMDYAVNDCGYNGDEFLTMFTTSGLARQFEHGNPRIIAGKSGVELAGDVLEKVTASVSKAKPSFRESRTPEYWAGWVLAHFQWYTALSFAAIERALPYSDVIKMYPTLHEADISKFLSTALELYHKRMPQTNLKRRRELMGYSQSELMRESGVSLRSIQMYEQRNKDINKALAFTLAKLARTLGCSVEDLLEPEDEKDTE